MYLDAKLKDPDVELTNYKPLTMLITLNSLFIVILLQSLQTSCSV